MHAAVVATAWVIGKDVLSPAAGSEKANAHQSAPVNRKRKDWLHIPEFHGLQSSVSKSLERLPKGPVTKARYGPYKLNSWAKCILGAEGLASPLAF